ncbi:MAG: substrate-binding domain-containing protein [Bacteroidales bacterium]|nr:substrate-binding domain-containing protein [Bacteroidales bacterium]
MSLGLLLTLISTGCKSGQKPLDETPTRGNIKIAVDESFQPLVDTEVYTFTSLYQNATIRPEYKPEVDVVNDFMSDSVKVMVTSRTLSEDQIAYLKEQLIVVRSVTFAYDALALITNKDNPDTLLTYNNVRDIIKGKVREWKEMEPSSKLGSISVIFDNTKSGNIRYFKERFEIADTLGDNFFAVNSNAEVIEFVSRNPDALGIISVNWISDKDDPQSTQFLSRVNVLAISQEFANDGYYYRPYQGFIADKSYPFIREVYMTSRETFAGLGSGFIQWATGEQGQRIVMKSGLVAATMPIRLVQVRTE